MNVHGFKVWHLVVAIAAVIVAGGAGTALALTGAISRPEQAVGYMANTVSAEALRCVDGPTAASLLAGQRVLIVARSEDSAWLGVRNPGATAETVWLPSDLLTLDPGEALDAGLPVSGECPEVVVTVDDAAPVPAPPGAPTPTTPSADATAPQLGSPSASAPIVACTPPDVYPGTVSVSVAASDNVGVSSVSISWSGRETGQAAMVNAGGGVWTYEFNPTDGGPEGDVTFRMVARDAAGNVSSEAVSSVFVACFG